MENQKLEHRTFQKGQVIFNEGDYESCMYEIWQGRVGVYANYGTDREKMLTELKEGELFGEMGLIECYPRSATVVALEDDTQTQIINAETFNFYFKDQPDKIFQVMEQLSRRIRGLTADYMEACRTVAEAVEAEESGVEKSSWLVDHLKKFGDVYDEALRVPKTKDGDPYSIYRMSFERWYW